MTTQATINTSRASRKNDHSPAKKRSRTNGPSRRSRQQNVQVDLKSVFLPTILQGFPKLPLDLLLETFSFLESPDLLHLSWSCHFFRNILQNKTVAAPTWRQARRNCVPVPPDCPPDCSEPEYANLLFDKDCHVCGQENSKDIVYVARIRCCPSCLATSFCTLHGLESELRSKHGLTSELETFFPMGKIIPSCFLKDKAEKRSYWGPPSRPSYMHYSREIAQWYLDELKALPNILVARLQWLSEKRCELKNKEDHAELCHEWEALKSRIRAAELSKKRNQRGEQILARLAAEGWEEDVTRMSEERKASFLLLPDAYIPRDLTDPQWEKIRGVMFGFMQDIRDAHRMEDSEKTSS
ncbi:hypothetical protein DL96DRAFT_1585839 [Flagelloscypha sp. PMI_526]|nr:hypothetical protein DL96DRAFT_1585839 [Flagelloscypha sp. PMI_526]